DLMTRLYIFSDDSMMGREAGTLGNVMGTTYIANEVKRMGLVPAGDSGTYFQTIPFKTRSVDSTSKLMVGDSALAFGTEWAVVGNASDAQTNLPVIFAGTLGDSSNMLPADQATGKLVVFMLPQGPAMRRAFRGAAKMAESAAGIAVIGPDQFMGFLRRPATFVDDPSNAPTTTPKPTIFLTAAAASKLFTMPIDSLKVGTAGRSATFDVKINIAPVPYPARNVVAILPGSDPKLKAEYVAVGAHNDHIGMTARAVDHDSMRIFLHIVRPGGAEDGGKLATPEQQAEVNTQLTAWRSAHPGTERLDSISNGADDDGSGSVSVLEVAEKMSSLKKKPKRSILFVWHVGEEKGLLGSAYYTDHPTVTRDSIVAQLNMDMVGRGDAWDVTGQSKEGAPLHGNSNYVQLVGSRRLSTELGDLIEKVNTEDKHGFTFDYSMDANGHPMNIYCRSDHYEYARYGIPITFFTTGGHSDYHQISDEAEYIDYPHMANVDKLVEDIAEHVANLDHRVVVDQPKPDPKGACQQ
ncbi:MAG: M28 family peptidase, partial [Gemmatimonadota bacterium]